MGKYPRITKFVKPEDFEKNLVTIHAEWSDEDYESNLCHECNENEATHRDLCSSCNLKIFGND